MAALLATISSIALFSGLTDAVPVEACFATFRWDDCGRPPQPVMYYWKPGSRCEVGIWKGCLPNINMFKDEYECVSTCIFAVRAQPPEFHQLNAEDETTSLPDYYEETTSGTNTTGDSTGDTGATGTGGTGEGGTGGADGGGGGGDGGADGGGGDQAAPAADGAATAADPGAAPADEPQAETAPEPDGAADPAE